MPFENRIVEADEIRVGGITLDATGFHAVDTLGNENTFIDPETGLTTLFNALIRGTLDTSNNGTETGFKAYDNVIEFWAEKLGGLPPDIVAAITVVDNVINVRREWKVGNDFVSLIVAEHVMELEGDSSLNLSADSVIIRARDNDLVQFGEHIRLFPTGDEFAEGTVEIGDGVSTGIAVGGLGYGTRIKTIQELVIPFNAPSIPGSTEDVWELGAVGVVNGDIVIYVSGLAPIGNNDVVCVQANGGADKIFMHVRNLRTTATDPASTSYTFLWLDIT